VYFHGGTNYLLSKCFVDELSLCPDSSVLISVNHNLFPLRASASPRRCERTLWRLSPKAASITFC
jgi:hypothetical protein